MWVNERRGKTWKAVERSDDPTKRRLTATLAPLHYESQLGSGRYDTDIDVRVTDHVGDRLNGWKMRAAGWHFGFQRAEPGRYQPPRGTFIFGGRQGENHIGLTPHRFGYLDTRDMSFDPIGGRPAYAEPVVRSEESLLGHGGEDPTQWRLHRASSIEFDGLWTTPNGGSVDWRLCVRPSRVKSDFIVREAARNWIANYHPPRSRSAWLGVVYTVNLDDIPRLNLRGVDRNKRGDSFNADGLKLQTAARNQLGLILPGKVFGEGRPGTVRARQHLFKRDGRWYFFIGAPLDEINRVLTAGDIVIDPAITEETITAAGDDACYMPGFSATQNTYGVYNRLYAGNYGGSVYSTGWRFQTIPIPQGSTISTASIDCDVQAVYGGGNANLNFYCEDIDDAPAFTIGAGDDVGGRTPTTAYTNVNAGWTTANREVSIATAVGEVIARGGWTSNNNIVVLALNNGSPTGATVAFLSYEGGSTTAFNAYYAAAGGGATGIEVIGHYYKHLLAGS